MPVLIECDTGFGRNGVQTPEAALELARLAGQLPGLALRGAAWSFPNTAPRTLEFFTARHRAVRRGRASRCRCSPAAARRRCNALADYPMMTEHRAGTYVYNDVMMVHSGVATWDDCAMHVRTTVVSRPTEDRAIVDAGSKVLTREQYYVKNFGRVVEYPDAVVANVSEEHGIIDLSACRRQAEGRRGRQHHPEPLLRRLQHGRRGVRRCATAGSRLVWPSPHAARCGELIERCA